MFENEEKGLIIEAMRTYNETETLVISEPCNCGSQIRHNNGGNYHQTVEIIYNNGNPLVRFSDTSELTDAGEWMSLKKYYPNVRALVNKYKGWL